VALAKAAKVFNMPTTVTTVETDGFSGNTYPELLAVFPQDKILECTPKAICGCWSMKMIWLFCGVRTSRYLAIGCALRCRIRSERRRNVSPAAQSQRGYHPRAARLRT